MEEKIWAVWRKNGGAPPTKRHATQDEAIAEAGRLAQQTNEIYFVLEVIGFVEPIITPVHYTEIK